MKQRILIALSSGFLVAAALFLQQSFAGNENLGESKFNKWHFSLNSPNAAVQAIESGNYAAWREIVGDDIATNVTAENFSRLTKAHQLMSEGQSKMESARVILEELGFTHGLMMGSGSNHILAVDQAALLEALKNNDYAAWKELMGSNSITEEITAENFSVFVEAHRLLQAGKLEEAKDAFESLGLKRGLGGRHLFKSMPGQMMFMNSEN